MNLDRLATHSLRVHPQGHVLAEIMTAMLNSGPSDSGGATQPYGEIGVPLVGDRRYECGARAPRIDGRGREGGGGYGANNLQSTRRLKYGGTAECGKTFRIHGQRD